MNKPPVAAQSRRLSTASLLDPFSVLPMFEVLRFWLDLGVDGVRGDALPDVIKDLYLRDNPKSLTYSEDQAPEQLAAYQRAGVHLLLNTSMLQAPFNASALRQIIDQVEAIRPIEAWPSRSAGNHDIPRLAERVGPANLRLASLLQFTVRGAAVMYYGDELGLEHIAVPPAKIRDPSGRADPRYGRDRFRVPMPWTRQAHAGFSLVEPWLPIDQRNLEHNVADQLADPESLLHFYRSVLQLRATEPALQSGQYWPIDVAEPLVAFRRGEGPQRGLLVALNVSDAPATLNLLDTTAELLLSTTGQPDSTAFRSQIPQQPREGIIARIQV